MSLSGGVNDFEMLQLVAFSGTCRCLKLKNSCLRLYLQFSLQILLQMLRLTTLLIFTTN